MNVDNPQKIYVVRDFNSNNIKSLYQVENDKKQKIVFKPNGDRFWQPFFLIFILIGILLFAISLIFNAYTYNSLRLDSNNSEVQFLNAITYSVSFAHLKTSASLFIATASLFAIAWIIRLFRAIVYVNLNKTVTLSNVDSYLIYKFSGRFVLYLFFTSLIITISLMAATDYAILNNMKHLQAFDNALGYYWYIAGIFAIITGSLFVVYVFTKIINQFAKTIKKYSTTTKDDDYLLMQQRKQEESFVKWLLNNILIWLLFIAIFLVVIWLFIYGTNAFHYFTFNITKNFVSSQFYIPLLSMWFSQISISAYVAGGSASFVIIFIWYVLLMNYIINNYDINKENKIRKEKARIERVSARLEEKENKRKIAH